MAGAPVGRDFCQVLPALVASFLQALLPVHADKVWEEVGECEFTVANWGLTSVEEEAVRQTFLSTTFWCFVETPCHDPSCSEGRVGA